MSSCVKSIRALLLGLLLIGPGLSSFSSPSAERLRQPPLTIYTYDSFVAEWGPAPQVIPAFEAKYGEKVTIVSAGDAGQLLARLLLEKEAPVADLVIGLDNNLLIRARKEGLLLPYRPASADDLPAETILDKGFLLTPYDYGYFAFIADTAKLEDLPRSLEDLTDSRFHEQIILEDPRTSSPGLGFLLWTIAVYGEDYLDYWRRLSPNVLAITDGWDSAYGMFTAGEAPLVLSYTTSPAYHVEYEATTRYQALIFPEGHYLQIEGMGVVKGAARPELARRFIDFAIGETFQNVIPLTNWMYPVSATVMLPDSYRYAPKPAVTLRLDEDEIATNQDRWIEDWIRVVSE